MMRQIRPSHAVILAVAAAVLVIVAFLLLGGVYRATRGPDGSLYVVNRFTGTARLVASRRVAAEKMAAVNTEADKTVAQLLLLKRLAEEVQSKGAHYVGDPVNKTLHEFEGRRYLLVFADRAIQEAKRGEKPELELCPLLRGIGRAETFSNFFAGSRAGYWPCNDCFDRFQAKAVRNARVRDYPDDSSPVAFALKPGDSVAAIGQHGKYAAIEAVYRATGKETICWVPRVALSFRQDPYTERWWRDARAAFSLSCDEGLSNADIAQRKGWKECYVNNLLCRFMVDLGEDDPTNPVLPE